MSNFKDQAARDVITRARTALLIDQPFFGTLAMRLELVEDARIKTLNVNGTTMCYNPTFVKSLTAEIMRSAVAHEVMHCVLDHCGPNSRGLALNPKKWNYAADYANNEILKQSGFKLGEDWLYDPQFTGKTAEQIYALIPDPPEDPDGGGNGGPQDEVLPGPTDPSIAAEQAADWQVATTQAATVAKQAGKLHESLDRFVQKMNEPKIDWRTELRRFVMQAAKNDYSWARLNRKMLVNGIYLPGLYSETCGPIVVYSDESGSVEENIVSAFGAEINAIKEDMRPDKLVLGHFADKVVNVEEFGPDDPFEMRRKCTGGTDFRPLFEHAASLPVPPACIIVLTDMYGPFPADSGGFPTLWVATTKKVAPFGETLPIEV